jgi:hypothetical protein
MASVAVGCVEATPKGDGGAKPTGRHKPFAFQWGAGSVAIEESVERDGEVLTLAWKATLTKEGERLRVSFSAGEVVDGLKEALGPKGTHPLFQVMPDLMVDPKDGRLVGVERIEEAIKGSAKLSAKTKAEERTLATQAVRDGVDLRARQRWEQWVRLIGFSQGADSETTDKAELQLEDGLKMPVATTTSHTKVEGASVVKIVRAFSGAAVAKVYKQVLASTGAPKAMVDAVEKVVREEHYEATLDPTTMRATKIRTRELTTVHNKGGAIELKAASETWTFVW